jgi:hypothetical protein
MDTGSQGPDVEVRCQWPGKEMHVRRHTIPNDGAAKWSLVIRDLRWN